MPDSDRDNPACFGSALRDRHSQSTTTEELRPSQADRGSPPPHHAFIDLHCHCLPGLDDGPRTLHDAVNLCRQLAGTGTSTIIATPHQLGRFEGLTTATIRAGARLLQKTLDHSRIPLRILPGAEVRLDERLLELIAADQVLTLGAAGTHLLLELPEDLFLNIRALLGQLHARGMVIILAHPERNRAFQRNPDQFASWNEFGVVWQITAGSLLGRHGPDARQRGWDCLAQAQAVCVASDAHRLSDPDLAQAYFSICRHLGELTARRACLELPGEVFAQIEHALAAREGH